MNRHNEDNADIGTSVDWRLTNAHKDHSLAIASSKAGDFANSAALSVAALNNYWEATRLLGHYINEALKIPAAEGGLVRDIVEDCWTRLVDPYDKNYGPLSGLMFCARLLRGIISTRHALSLEKFLYPDDAAIVTTASAEAKLHGADLERCVVMIEKSLRSVVLRWDHFSHADPSLIGAAAYCGTLHDLELAAKTAHLTIRIQYKAVHIGFANDLR